MASLNCRSGRLFTDVCHRGSDDEEKLAQEEDGESAAESLDGSGVRVQPASKFRDGICVQAIPGTIRPPWRSIGLA